jgi:hypothetical protein
VLFFQIETRKRAIATLENYMLKYLAVLVALSSYPTLAQIGTGSIIVINRTQDKWALAADSREISPAWPLGGPPDDTSCKIAAFRSEMAFASTGAARMEDFALLHWNNTEVARKAIAASERDATLKQIAESWAHTLLFNWRVAYVLEPQSVIYMASLQNGMLTDGFFARYEDGKIATQFIAIFLSQGEIYARDVVLQCPGKSLCAFGRTSIFNEFSQAETERSKAKTSAWLKENAVPPSNGMSLGTLLAMKFVEWSEIYDPTKVLAGPIDALELWGDGSIHWIARKQNCPENQD